MTMTILVADDEATQRAIIEHVVKEQLGYRVVTVPGGQEAIDHVLSGRDPQPDLMLLDLSMPRVNGIAVIKTLHPLRPHLPIIVLTAHGSLEMAVEAVRSGAIDFLAKPAEPERLNLSLKNALRMRVLGEEVSRMQRNVDGQILFSDIIGASPALRTAVQLGHKAAASSIPVLIEGEGSTGKQLLARAIHGSSDRAGRPFVAVKCSAIPEAELESTLFGRRRNEIGANLILGKCLEAEGGTLFLDNVGRLKPSSQVKLLKLIQERMIEPLGSREGIQADIRVIAATGHPLEADVQRGEFRQDLYYLLNAFPINLPPLRERREDIPLLLEHALQRIAAMENKAIHGLSSEAMNELKRFDWPGNMRQLENAVFRAVVLCERDMLGSEDFRKLLGHDRAAASGNVQPLADSVTNGHAARLSQGTLTVTDNNGNVRRMIDLEIDMIRFALRYYDGHMFEVARRLGIGRSTLYRKINDFGIIENSRRAG